MAFQQPQRPRPARPLSFSQPAQQQPVEPSPVSPQRKNSLVESEEWILFSPSAAGSVGRTHTTSSERTPRTAGLSRLSDFGSLDTAARSEGYEEPDDDDLTCQGTDPEDDGDAEELDSLDDGLHAFHEPSLNAQQFGESDQTVFPTHDGLGTFPNSSAVQDQLWQFERYNASPRKTKVARRRSSVQRRLDVLEETEALEQDERRQRIERWRLEQSRALLEEIEKETRRRRRMSRASIAKSAAGSVVGEGTRTATATEAGPSATTDASRIGTTPDDSPESESFWQRITRRVIRDLMGIDENLLSVIFGESLPAEATSGHSASTAGPKDILAEAAAESDFQAHRRESWEHRLLERIARELGVLVNQLSEHPGAFSTYLRAQETPAYAGLSSLTNNTSGPQSNIAGAASGPSPISAQSQSASNIVFPPTVTPQPTYSEASLWGIEEEPEPESVPTGPGVQSQHEREYWERDLDVKMVFNFLKERFSSRPTSPVNGNSPYDSRRDSAFHSKSADGSGSVSQERANMIRQHHPLVSRNLQTSSGPGNNNLSSSSRPSPAPAATTTITVPVPVSSQNLRRARLNAGSSCASQSTRRSKRSGSSRNYWDLGGSVGSGPAGAPGAATWGEV